MRVIRLIAIIFIVILSRSLAQEPVKFDLRGTWRFLKDSASTGVIEKVFLKELPETVYLPGSMATNGKGDKLSVNTVWTGRILDSSFYKLPKYEKYRQPNNFKVPFWFTPIKYYAGLAWYQKEVEIPQSWQNKHIKLFLERCHWETRVWVDDKECGMENALCAPHLHDLTQYLTPGKHKITIAVDNRRKTIDPGQDAHSISDNTQSNWNGIVGRIELTAASKLMINNVKLYPNIADKSVKVVMQIDNQTGNVLTGKIELGATSFNTEKSTIIPAHVYNFKAYRGKNQFEYTYEMGKDVLLWDEFSPNLYKLNININNGKGGVAQTEVQFGMKEFKIQDTRFYVNGKQTFLRGTLECCIFPNTGYPAMNVDEWKKMFKICHSYGLNHMRFHSWCPPEAAFDAADQMGFYLQVESSAWATIGDGSTVDTWLYEESEHIVDTYGNHPSFCLMTYGNEPFGKNHKIWLAKFVNYWKNKDNRRVYSSSSGWPDDLAESEFCVTSAPRIQAWGAGLSSLINSKAPSTSWDHNQILSRFNKPVVTHEIGQWCAYPDFSEVNLYTGVLRPYNFDIFKESLENNHLGEHAHDFLMASGKLQTLCYKADLEGVLRTKDIAGFQLLDLHDFPGQGTALVGVMNAFWNDKGYVTGKEYSRFCNTLVPLARIEKLILTSDESFKAAVEVANFNNEALQQANIQWFIRNTNKEIVASGNFTKDIAIGNGIKLGDIQVPLNTFKAPEKYNLEVKIGTFTNDWNFWVYPQKLPEVNTDNLTVVTELNEKVLSILQKGKNVLFVVPKDGVKPDKGGDIAIGFSSIFWNTTYTLKQAPHTLGIFCDPAHPALAQFPTEYHSDYNWWDAMTNSKPVVLDGFCPELKPIVSVIDDWVTNRRLALVFEAAVAKGKLLICSVDLLYKNENRPEARQLLYSLSKYAASEAFNPEVTLSFESIKSLFQNPSIMSRAKVLSVDSSEPHYEGAKAIDQNLNSFWHSSWAKDKNFFPHEIQIDLEKSTEFRGFTYSPRQDNVPTGTINEFEFYVSDKPDSWGIPVAKGNFSRDKSEKTVIFGKYVKGRYFRLVGVKGFDNETNASAAEINLIP